MDPTVFQFDHARVWQGPTPRLKLAKPNSGPGRLWLSDSGRPPLVARHVRPRGDPARVPANGEGGGVPWRLGENWGQWGSGRGFE